MSTTTGRCGRCGTNTQTKSVRTVRVDLCPRCGTVTLDQAALERLAGARLSESTDTGPQPAPLTRVPAGRQPTPLPSPPQHHRKQPRKQSAQELNEPSLGLDSLRNKFNEPSLGLGGPTPDGPASMDSFDDRTAETEIADPTTELSQLSDDQFEAELAAITARKRQRQRLMLIFALLGLIALLMSIPFGYGVYAAVRALQGSEPTEEAALGDVMSTPEPVPEPVVEEPKAKQKAAKAEPKAKQKAKTKTKTKAAKAAPAPAPSTSEAPKPKPSGGGGASVKALTDKGWDTVGRDPAAAARLFKQALDKKSSDPDANLGYGYALIQQGQASSATPYLCKAQKSGDTSIQREAGSFLKNNGLTCN